MKNECSSNYCNVFAPSNHGGNQLHNRFNILSSIESCHSHMKSHSKNTDIFADQKNMNVTVAENSCAVVQSSLTGQKNLQR